MASSKARLEYVLAQLQGSEAVSFRAMMGEYILYCRGKVIGGIYDDRFLVKATKSAVTLMPKAAMVLPYQGAKKMLLVDELEDRAFLQKLLEALCQDLPAPKESK